MSLVGSLEDLGLGDILQIISLSRKSGMLVLRADEGEGQIVFAEGAIASAFSKGGPTSLRELLARRGSVTGADLEGAEQESRRAGRSLEEVLVERGLALTDELENLRRDHVESSVIAMFAWSSGEFSFEISDVPDAVAGDLQVSPGLNPQFLALEGTRFRDEVGRDARGEEAEPLLEPELPGGPGGSSAAEAEPEEQQEQAFDLDAAFAPHDAEPELQTESEPRTEPEPRAEPESARAEEARREEAAAAPVEVERPRPWSPPRVEHPIVVVDGDLACLEWIKEALADVAPQVHIFQRSDHGMNRIRQYLARAQPPLVLLAADAPADSLSGARDAREMVSRLKSQAEHMRILLLAEEGRETATAGADGVAWKPTPSHLADARCVKERESLAVKLREAVLAQSAPEPVESPRPSGLEDLSPETLEKLKVVSDRLRDRESSGEVLNIVLHFALDTFSRVALFMVRDDLVHGLAQLNLGRGGGPDDAGLREVSLPVREPGWFRRVLDERKPLRGGPKDAGDQRLAVLLGNAIPEEAYVAPLESGDQVVALLYGDNLPGQELIGDTSALELVLQQAGLVLDRACLERILDQAGGV